MAARVLHEAVAVVLADLGPFEKLLSPFAPRKQRSFRGAKGDDGTVISRTVLTSRVRTVRSTRRLQSRGMNLYLDDDSAKSRLVSLLRQAGHGVRTPSDADMTGSSDARHFEYSTRNCFVLVTRNYDDFLELHDVVQAAAECH